MDYVLKVLPRVKESYKSRSPSEKKVRRVVGEARSAGRALNLSRVLQISNTGDFEDLISFIVYTR